MSDPRTYLRALLDATTADTVTAPRAWIEELVGPSDTPSTLAIDKTAEEIGALFGKKAVTIRAWIRQGRFPGAYQLGKEWRIPASAIRAFQESERAGAASTDLGAWRKQPTTERRVS